MTVTTEKTVAVEAVGEVFKFLSKKMDPATVADAMFMEGTAALAVHIGRAEVAWMLRGLADRIEANAPTIN